MTTTEGQKALLETWETIKKEAAEEEAELLESMTEEEKLAYLEAKSNCIRLDANK